MIFIKSTRVGGTTAAQIALGYWISNEPGDVLTVMPSEDAAKEEINLRVKPMLEASDNLKQHMSNDPRDTTLAEIHLPGRMRIYTGWSGSPQSLGSKTCRYVRLDEIDKYSAFSGREADPMSLAKERTGTWPKKKHYITSTPTTREGAIWKAWEACGDQRRYFVPCPHCKHEQTLTFPQVKWPKEITDKVKLADAIEQDKLAWYECEKCKEKILDFHKPKMLIAGRWKSEGGKSKRVGFHINALYSPWKTFSDIAAEFIRAEGDIALTMNFRNSRMAEPFEQQVATNRPSIITDRKAGAPQPNEFPSWGEIAILTADVQQDSLWFVIRAWARGFRSQLIRYGQILNFNELWHQAFENQIGGRGPVEFVGVDGRYRTSEVIEFARRLPQHISITQGMTESSKGVICQDVIREGLRYLKVDTQLSKDRLQHMLGDADKSRWQVHSEVGEDYANQLASEHKIVDQKARKLIWLPKYKGIANHLLDCEANQCAIAAWLGMDQPAPPPAAGPVVVRRESPDGPTWFDKGTW